jgi:hypothetical protein
LLVDARISEKHTVSLIGAKDGDGMFLWNAGISRWVYMVPKSRTLPTSTFIVVACYLHVLFQLWF